MDLKVEHGKVVVIAPGCNCPSNTKPKLAANELRPCSSCCHQSRTGADQKRSGFLTSLL